MNNKFGKTIRRRRLALRGSLLELAVETDMSESYISLIERGLRPPPVDRLIRVLADVLILDSDKLFFLAGRLPPDVQTWVERYPGRVTKLIRDEWDNF